MKKNFKVYWSFDYHQDLKSCSCIEVSAYSRQEAKSIAARHINNPMAWIIVAQEK